MSDFPTIESIIGNTPLVRLQRLPGQTSNIILGKLEGNNPAGSVKDRPVVSMIRHAQLRGDISPGDTLIEATSGNTGIALAMVAAILGYKMILIMPANMSSERRASMRAYGAEIILVEGMEVARDLALEMQADGKGKVLNQFGNFDNPLAHYETTGPEICEQTGGKVDAFVCAVGTGGTLAGVARALRARNPDIRIALSDPGGSGLHNFFTHGEVKIEGSSITEGIGNSRITKNLEDTVIDMSWHIPDDEAIPLVYEMIRNEGLVLGGSSGINVAGAMRMAREMGPGHTIVTILCDSALRYQERLFNRDYLESKGLQLPDWY